VRERVQIVGKGRGGRPVSSGGVRASASGDVIDAQSGSVGGSLGALLIGGDRVDHAGRVERKVPSKLVD
jgi:hypothetical protein